MELLLKFQEKHLVGDSYTDMPAVVVKQFADHFNAIRNGHVSRENHFFFEVKLRNEKKDDIIVSKKVVGHEGMTIVESVMKRFDSEIFTLNRSKKKMWL